MIPDTRKGLKPFFTYYGGKWRAAPRYPAPRCDTVIEPFAGAAGYAVRYPEKNVILIEKDEQIAAMWHYIIHATEQEILALPDLAQNETTDNLSVPQEAKTLIGFWLQKGARIPGKKASVWMREGINQTGWWGNAIRERIASQLSAIRHWKIITGDYTMSPNVEATWFIDPPYEISGKIYRCGSDDIDFHALAEWCKSRKGQVMVCENVGATWLPFTPFMSAKATPGKATPHSVIPSIAENPLYRPGKSAEAIWLNDTGESP